MSRADRTFAHVGPRTATETGGAFVGVVCQGAWVQNEFWRAALFSVPLADDDFAVLAMLLTRDNLTMAPRIASFPGTTQTTGTVMFAVAAVVSTTAPLLLLMPFFQRQIVSGRTPGAVKG